MSLFIVLEFLAVAHVIEIEDPDLAGLQVVLLVDPNCLMICESWFHAVAGYSDAEIRSVGHFFADFDDIIFFAGEKITGAGGDHCRIEPDMSCGICDDVGGAFSVFPGFVQKI